MDDSCVVSYSPALSLKFNCHINVEVVSSVKSVKYLYKYCFKGSDKANVGVYPFRLEMENPQFRAISTKF